MEDSVNLKDNIETLIGEGRLGRYIATVGKVDLYLPRKDHNVKL